MDLQIELKNGVMTVLLFGELDHHTVSRIRQEIDSAALKVKPHILRMDFMNVPFMDSSGIGLILGRVRMTAVWGGKVVLCGLSPQLKRMAELSGVARLAVFEKSVKEA